MANTEKEVKEDVGEVSVIIQRTGDLTSDLQVFCYTVAGNNHKRHTSLSVTIPSVT